MQGDMDALKATVVHQAGVLKTQTHDLREARQARDEQKAAIELQIAAMEVEKTHFQEELARALARATAAETELWKATPIRRACCAVESAKALTPLCHVGIVNNLIVLNTDMNNFVPIVTRNTLIVSYFLRLQRPRDRREHNTERCESATSQPASP